MTDWAQVEPSGGQVGLPGSFLILNRVANSPEYADSLASSPGWWAGVGGFAVERHSGRWLCNFPGQGQKFRCLYQACSPAQGPTALEDGQLGTGSPCLRRARGPGGRG